jgi:hypothetical protein
MIESVTLDENGDDKSWHISECEICLHLYMDASVKWLVIIVSACQSYKLLINHTRFNT